jgi:hypothetical protein
MEEDIIPEQEYNFGELHGGRRYKRKNNRARREENIFLIQRFVSVVLGPHSLMGGCGGDLPPPQLSPGGSRGGGGGATIFVSPPPPPGGGFGGSAPEAKFWEKLPCKIL